MRFSERLSGLVGQFLFVNRSHRSKGDRYRDAKDWSAAASSYSRYLTWYPRDAAIWVQLGHALKEQSGPASAVEPYHRASLLAPDDYETLLHLAHALKNAGQIEEASIIFRKLLDMRDYRVITRESAPIDGQAPGYLVVHADMGDVNYCFHLLLGRECDTDSVLGGAGKLTILDLCRNLVLTKEFEANVVEPLEIGRVPTFGLFALPASEAVMAWAQANLGVPNERFAFSDSPPLLGEYLAAILSDNAFAGSVFSVGSRQAAAIARLDGWHPVGATKEDIEHMYELFWGQPREQLTDFDWRLGRSLVEVVGMFVNCSEFEASVFARMMSAASQNRKLFTIPPTRELRKWAASRLPLGRAHRSLICSAETWTELHLSIFSDPFFGSMTGLADVSLRLLAASNSLEFHAKIVQQARVFERDWYLATYPDVTASGGDPLAHYIRHGVEEGRNPARLFDTRWYLTAYPEACARGLNPLVHYVVAGAARGYDTNPFFSSELFFEHNPTVVALQTSPLAAMLDPLLKVDTSFIQPFGPYDVEKATLDIERGRERPEIERHIEHMIHRPVFYILGADEAAAESLKAQTYDNYRVVPDVNLLMLDAQSSQEPAFVLWLEQGTVLSWDALYEVAAALNAQPSLDMIYFDHDIAGPGMIREPVHKPAWSPDTLEGRDYIGPAVCFSLKAAARHLACCNCRYDLMLRIVEKTVSVAHIDRILMTVSQRSVGLELVKAQEAKEVRALEGRLIRTGRQGKVVPLRSGAYAYDLRLSLDREPLVSIVMPTAAKVIKYQGRSIDLVVSCIDSIVAKSTYSNYEIVIVDNGDFDRNRLAHIKETYLTYLTYSDDEVNIAKKINIGAAAASGEIFVLMNDDIEVISGDWLERMIVHLEKPHVGVVGAKLLYPDMTIQHAGVVIPDGLPEHVRRGFPRDDEGFWFSTCLPRNYIAVTGAVSMVRADDFRMVNGYTEVLPIDFNDIDFCLKLWKSGRYNLYEPKAELVHYESVSAVRLPRPHDAELFWRTWGAELEDPFYNTYSLSKRPATGKPAYSERRS